MSVQLIQDIGIEEWLFLALGITGIEKTDFPKTWVSLEWNPNIVILPVGFEILVPFFAFFSKSAIVPRIFLADQFIREPQSRSIGIVGNLSRQRILCLGSRKLKLNVHPQTTIVYRGNFVCASAERIVI